MNPVLIPTRPSPRSPLSERELQVHREDPGQAAARAHRPRRKPGPVILMTTLMSFAKPRFQRQLTTARRKLPTFIVRNLGATLLSCFVIGLLAGRAVGTGRR
jgi:hypothetical protein